MKRQAKLRSLVLAAALMTGLAGCQPEEQNPLKETEDANALLLEQVSSSTQQYLEDEEQIAYRGGPFAVLAADIKGAIRGWKEGYSFGEFDIQGQAAALLSGIAASQAAAGLNPGNEGNMGPHNPNNPYDRFGALHYELMDEIYANPSAYFRPGGGVEFPAYYNLVFGRLVTEGIVTEDERPLFPLATLESMHPSFLGNESVLAYSNGLSHAGYEPIERAILGQYFGALLASHNVNAFTNYSMAIEDQVETSTLSHKSKAFLGMVMATTRYGRAYWN